MHRGRRALIRPSSPGILSQSAAIQQAAADAGMTLTVDPEKMANYEVGAKGRLFDGSMTYSIAAYYAQWRKQINSILLTLPNGTCTNGIGYVSFVSGYSNLGSVNLYGVGGQFAWRPVKLISIDSIDGGAAINVTNIRDFVSSTITALSGFAEYSGNEMPNTSKYSANLGVQFGGNVKGQDDMTWFARADWNYKSDFYSNQANLATTSDATRSTYAVGSIGHCLDPGIFDESVQ